MEENTGNVLTAIAVEALQEVGSGKVYQFTRRANWRVKHARADFEERLRRDIFRDRTDVDLLEVELAILGLEQAEAKRENLEADADDLFECDAQLEHCAREFLPKKWVKTVGGGKYTKLLGNFFFDIAEGDVLAVCVKCQDDLCQRITERNNRIVANCGPCQDPSSDDRHNDHAGSDENNRTIRFPLFTSSHAANALLKEHREELKLAEERRSKFTERKAKANESASKLLNSVAKASDYRPRKNNNFGTHGHKR